MFSMMDLLQPLDYHGREGRGGGRETDEGELARGGSGTSLRKNVPPDEVYVTCQYGETVLDHEVLYWMS